MQELYMRQMSVAHEVRILRTVVGIERGGERLRDQAIHVRHRARENYRYVLTHRGCLREGVGVSNHDEEGFTDPFEIWHPHTHLVGSASRRIPVEHELRCKLLNACWQLFIDLPRVIAA